MHRIWLTSLCFLLTVFMNLPTIALRPWSLISSGVVTKFPVFIYLADCPCHVLPMIPWNPMINWTTVNAKTSHTAPVQGRVLRPAVRVEPW